jgi:glycosyltransferase involved in cell wall biosynthesis
MNNTTPTANQYPHRLNRISRTVRRLASYLPALPLKPVPSPKKPQGISVYMRIKDERDWIQTAIASITGIADEIIAMDNGSTDGTWEMLQDLASQRKGQMVCAQAPDLRHAELSNAALDRTTFRWVFRFDGDMVAHTGGPYDIVHLRTRIMSLPTNRYFVIYLRHVNLSGDLLHQDPQEQVHIEEYIHTFSPAARFVHPGRFEAVSFPLYYRPLFWYDPYVFHVNIKPAHRMLLRRFWEEWMEKKEYDRYPTLESYVQNAIPDALGTADLEEAEARWVRRVFQKHIPFDPGKFGPYPDLLKPHLDSPTYQLLTDTNGRITGRREDRKLRAGETTFCRMS